MSLRLSQLAVELLIAGMPACRLSQVAVEALVPADSPTAGATVWSSSAGGVATWTAASGVALQSAGGASASWAAAAVAPAAAAAAGGASASWAGEVVAITGIAAGGSGAASWAGQPLALSAWASAGGASASWAPAGSAPAALQSAGGASASWAGEVAARSAWTAVGGAVVAWGADLAFQAVGSAVVAWGAIAPRWAMVSSWGWARARLRSANGNGNGVVDMPKCYVLPGFFGSALESGPHQFGRRLWVNSTRLVIGEWRGLRLAEDGVSPAPEGGQALISGVPLEGYQDSLVGALRSQLGPKGYDVVVYAYDWRLRLRRAGHDLAQRIRAEASSDSPASIVAHSQGGLVARAAYADLAATGQAGLVRRIITIGTPHRGTYRGVKIFAREDPLVETLAWYVNLGYYAQGQIFPLGPHPIPRADELIQLTASWQALYELLPILDDAALSTDPRRVDIYNASLYPHIRGVRQDLLDYARYEFQPWLKSPAAQVAPAVLTTVAGTDSATPYRLNIGGSPGDADTIGYTPDGDGTVTVDSALVPGSRQITLSADHQSILVHRALLDNIGAWVVEERPAPAPVPSPESLPGESVGQLVGPPLPYPVAAPCRC